jgi:hypothetical protein
MEGPRTVAYFHVEDIDAVVPPTLVMFEDHRHFRVRGPRSSASPLSGTSTTAAEADSLGDSTRGMKIDVPLPFHGYVVWLTAQLR